MNVNEGLLRFGGMYGEAYRGSTLLADVIEVTAAVDINRIDVPLVGTTRMGSKTGRETREGSLRIHQIDSAWELELHAFLSSTLPQRRQARNAGQPLQRPFDLTLRLDDPDTLGVWGWRLSGVVLWRQELGIGITNDLQEREYPITWEREDPIDAFRRKLGADGQYINEAEPVYAQGVRVG